MAPYAEAYCRFLEGWFLMSEIPLYVPFPRDALHDAALGACPEYSRPNDPGRVWGWAVSYERGTPRASIWPWAWCMKNPRDSATHVLKS